MPIRRKILLLSLELSDIFIFFFSLLFVELLIHKGLRVFTLQEILFSHVRIIHVIIFIISMFLWHIVFVCFNLYRSRRLEKGRQEWKDIFKATTLFTLLGGSLGYYAGIQDITLFTGVLFWTVSTLSVILSRRLMRLLLSLVRVRGRNLRFILIVGTNKRAYDFAREIEENKELGYRIFGFIDNDIHLPNTSIKFLGTLKDFPDIIRNHVVDEVIIALPIKSHYNEIYGIIQKAKEQGIIIRHLPQLFDSQSEFTTTSLGENMPLLTITGSAQEGWQYILKRLMDVGLGTVFLILTSPVFLLAALAIRLTSPGPVFYVQERVGYNKRLFRLYKFRTMVHNADKLQSQLEHMNEMDGPVFKIKNDPRITKVGRFMRRFSIDELPQLINVIKGDMSLIGPRPLPLRDFSRFEESWQLRRCSVLPGLTCLWQINGRNNISFEEWMKMDMEYIDKWSIKEDFKILLKTIPSVIMGKGAA